MNLNHNKQLLQKLEYVSEILNANITNNIKKYINKHYK